MLFRSIIFDLLQKTGSKSLTTEVSAYLMASVYKMFRTVYSANPKNPQGLFAAQEQTQQGLSTAVQCVAEANAVCIASGCSTGEMEGLDREHAMALSPEILSQQYPLFASSLYNLIQNTEARMGVKKNGK